MLKAGPQGRAAASTIGQHRVRDAAYANVCAAVNDTHGQHQAGTEPLRATRRGGTSRLRHGRALVRAAICWHLPGDLLRDLADARSLDGGDTPVLWGTLGLASV